jgi:4-aminobutyrate aminotransferase-like enzyme
MTKSHMNTRFMSENLLTLVKEIGSIMPGDKLKYCYFVNSGSEANDLALRLARNYTKRQRVMVIDNAYHGNTQAGIDISPYKFNRKGGKGPNEDNVYMVPFPDQYRGPFGYDDPYAGEKYAKDVERKIEEILGLGLPAPAAFICESIQGVGGNVPVPKGYLPKVYDMIRKIGGVCIADEVQSGFGRVGAPYWWAF